MKYYQVELELMGFKITTWIEERGAKVGNKIELTEFGETWNVLSVYNPGIEEAVLKENQRLNRNSLSSLH